MAVISCQSKKGRQCLHGKTWAFCVPCGGSQIVSACVLTTSVSTNGDALAALNAVVHKSAATKSFDPSVSTAVAGTNGPSDSSQICQHKRQKAKCKDCKGSHICEHNRQKDYCKECKGRQICVHSKHRAYCKDCMGSMICRHKREKLACKDCKAIRLSSLFPLSPHSTSSELSTGSYDESDLSIPSPTLSEGVEPDLALCPHGKPSSLTCIRCLCC